MSDMSELAGVQCLTQTALVLPESLPEADWRALGHELAAHHDRHQWHIGDWWAYGQAKYGARKAMTQAPDWDGPAFDTCVSCATVARKFESRRRRRLLSFTHHREVCMLPPADADACLDWAEREHAGTMAVRAYVKERQGRPLSEQGLSDADLCARLEQFLEGKSKSLKQLARRTLAIDRTLTIGVLEGKHTISAAHAMAKIIVQQHRAAMPKRTPRAKTDKGSNVVPLIPNQEEIYAQAVADVVTATRAMWAVRESHVQVVLLAEKLSPEQRGEVWGHARAAMPFFTTLCNTLALYWKMEQQK